MAQAADSGSYYDFGGSERRKLRLAELLMGEGASTAPVQHWTQGVARALQGAYGGHLMHKAEQAEKDHRCGNGSTTTS